MIRLLTCATRRLKIGAAAILAAGLLAGAVAPSAAATWPHERSFPSASPHHPGAHRHFWRGTELSRPLPTAEMTALADESMQADAAMSYCASRFRSYDPSTGTYLGYDGHEHSCP